MKRENIINYDSQGWPVCKMNLKEILEELGAKEFITKRGVILGFYKTNPALSIFPKTVEDDGMGYGVNAQYITEANTGKSENGNFITFFRDKEISNASLWLEAPVGFEYSKYILYEEKPSYFYDIQKVNDSLQFKLKVIDSESKTSTITDWIPQEELEALEENPK